MHRISKLRSFAMVAALAAFASTPVAAELAAWDQATVTSVAQDLAKAADGWWMAAREQPGSPAEAQPDTSIVSKARTLQEMSAGLAAHLKEGQGHDKTLDDFRSIQEVHDDTVVSMQQTMVGDQAQQAWQRFDVAYKKIAPYYDPNAAKEALQ